MVARIFGKSSSHIFLFQNLTTSSAYEARHRAPLSVPPAPPPFHGIRPPPVSPWNGIRAPLVPPTPPSQVQPSGLGRLAPPLTASSWGGILTPTAFNMEYGGQDLGSQLQDAGRIVTQPRDNMVLTQAPPTLAGQPLSDVSEDLDMVQLHLFEALSRHLYPLLVHLVHNAEMSRIAAPTLPADGRPILQTIRPPRILGCLLAKIRRTGTRKETSKVVGAIRAGPSCTPTQSPSAWRASPITCSSYLITSVLVNCPKSDVISKDNSPSS
ncbi:hypothetical protein BT96DRAFT_996219 [Gymnopus androsaceus JB14]|uniref:Uncharacterized protein n=1 Tax=Gymnopus androsaceus JB14 TaxID=1447944 RepID=A0A6A4HIL9_9AGAR|nr:hypothetical protein BT96DRAFT_996219 [Gymnopus androsaceus JB14]